MGNVRKSAFAMLANGDRYVAYRDNVLLELSKYAPGVDVIEIDISKVEDMFSVLSPQKIPYFARLAIPMLDDFSKYDRVVWLDSDVDIVSERFSGILDVDSVQTSDDGLAAVPDVLQDDCIAILKKRLPSFNKTKYFNSGVLVIDLFKINRNKWSETVRKGIWEYIKSPFKWMDQDILNAYFDIREIDVRFNWMLRRGVDNKTPSWLYHYCDTPGHARLDNLIDIRRSSGFGRQNWANRCVVVSPRHAFIRSWIRAYFASGNNIPLIIVPGPDGDWQDGDMEYCVKAAEYCGGMVFDCSKEWSDSQRLAERAVLKNRIGWYTKKSILHAVASRLAPRTWAWVDDDAEITDNIGECFDYSEKAPGFICAQFYCPDEIDNRHPASTYRSNIDTGDKICWNSFVLFHGEANLRISESLGKDFPVEDDEIVFCDLYKKDPRWHEGFCDLYTRNWQAICKRTRDIPHKWFGKVIHYTAWQDKGAVKQLWANKASQLPKAPFEQDAHSLEGGGIPSNDDDVVDAVFVIGTGSEHDNEELRYALRNIDKHCGFVRDVYICGFCPPWVNKSRIKHLDWLDRFSHAKDANIIDKLRHACEHPGIAKKILFCSDDQFQTRKCSWGDFRPRYLRRYLSIDRWYEVKDRTWHYRLMRTLEREVGRRQLVGLCATDVFYYQPHMWMQIDRDKFIEYARVCGYETRDDTIIASGYFNYVNVDGVPNFDHEFIVGHEAKMPSSTHIAYYDPSFESAMSILHKLFPDKCRFEL